MSFTVTAAVWKHGRARGVAQHVLLALAEHADRWGRCYPSVERLAAMTGLSDRTVQRALRELQTTGELVVTAGGGRGRASSYYIVAVSRATDEQSEKASERRLLEPVKGDNVTPFTGDENGDNVSGKGDKSAGKGDNVSEKGDRLSPQPVINRSVGTGHRTGTPPPTPSPQAGKGRESRRERRNGTVVHDDVPAAVELAEPLTPATTDDRMLWHQALMNGFYRTMKHGNAALVNQLEPIGRTSSGALVLRAPPGSGLGERFRPYIVKALADAGDERAADVRIVEHGAA